MTKARNFNNFQFLRRGRRSIREDVLAIACGFSPARRVETGSRAIKGANNQTAHMCALSKRRSCSAYQWSG